MYVFVIEVLAASISTSCTLFLLGISFRCFCRDLSVFIRQLLMSAFKVGIRGKRKRIKVLGGKKLSSLY